MSNNYSIPSSSYFSLENFYKNANYYYNNFLSNENITSKKVVTLAIGAIFTGIILKKSFFYNKNISKKEYYKALLPSIGRDPFGVSCKYLYTSVKDIKKYMETTGQKNSNHCVLKGCELRDSVLKSTPKQVTNIVLVDCDIDEKILNNAPKTVKKIKIVNTEYNREYEIPYNNLLNNFNPAFPLEVGVELYFNNDYNEVRKYSCSK